MSERRLESLKFLPRKRETWQGGLVRLPAWVTDKGSEPFRAWGGVWVSLGSTKAHIGKICNPGAKSPEQALEAFLEFALDRKVAGYLPDRVEVTGEEVAAVMRQALAPLQVEVARRDRVFGVEGFLDALAQHENEGEIRPGVLEPPGMTVERFESFAEAARLYFEAAPWRHLSNDDLLRIEGKGIQGDLRHGVVLGAAGSEFGLMLFEKRSLHDAILSNLEPGQIFKKAVHVSVFFGPIQELPLQDSDIFLDRRIPVAGPSAYPWAARIGPGRKFRRLGPPLLAQVEAILRALAATTETEIDQGKWSRLVPSASGTLQITLALPDVLEPPEPRRKGERMPQGSLDRRSMERAMAEMQRFIAGQSWSSMKEMNEAIEKKFQGLHLDDIPSTAGTPLEKAQDLCYQAMDARGRRRILLVRRALEICPDCADAYVVLAEQARDPGEARRLYGDGVAAGERAMGPGRFKDDEAPFWGDVTTRPFMRALQGLAESCEATGHLKEAVLHYRRLLRLNPNDNQGARYPLSALLLRTGDDETLDVLLKQFERDRGSFLPFAGALQAFRRAGDTAVSRKLLRKAVKRNPHVSGLLLEGEDLLLDRPDSYTLGGEAEAVECAATYHKAWREVPGALEWLKTRTEGASR
jgi:tetratricopeptide (TPR) repeat protein